jgi:predicted amidohydrolase YtcJ
MTDGARKRGSDGRLLVLADRIHPLAAGTPGGASALLVDRGRVAAIGTAADLRRRFAGVPTLDLTGSVITPGLTDAHIHLTEWAFARAQVQLSGARSPEEAAARAADHAARRSVPASAWILGHGWSDHLWGGARPHRRILDDRLGGRPAALQSHDMHALWASSAALEAAGIGPDTPDPEGGRIQRDATGEPTGLLLEWAGRLVTAAIPRPDADSLLDLVADAQAELHRYGIVSVHSLPGIHMPDPDPLPLLLRLREQGRLRLRVLQHIPLERLDDAIRLGIRSGFGDDWIRIGGVKMFLDGALGSRTAWMREPYEDGSGCGMNTLDPADFDRTVRRAAAAGIATTVHAIGDAAVCLALDVLRDPALRVPALPHRIEHMQCCPADRFGDAAAAGITASVQPCHLMTDWRIADRYWGAHRNRGTFAFASLLAAGTSLAFGSDAPVEPVDPRRSLFAAVHRQDEDGMPGAGWFPGERLSRRDALLCFTTGPAAAAGLPPPWGTLAVGAPADLAAWNEDPIADGTSLLDIECTAALVAGMPVHTT